MGVGRVSHEFLRGFPKNCLEFSHEAKGANQPLIETDGCERQVFSLFILVLVDGPRVVAVCLWYASDGRVGPCYSVIRDGPRVGTMEQGSVLLCVFFFIYIVLSNPTGYYLLIAVL